MGGNNGRAVKIKGITTNEEFTCMKDAYTKYNISKYYLVRSLKLNSPDTNGYYWEKLVG